MCNEDTEYYESQLSSLYERVDTLQFKLNTLAKLAIRFAEGDDYAEELYKFLKENDYVDEGGSEL